MTLWNSKKWVDALDALVANYNSSIHTTTKMKPVDIHKQTLEKKITEETTKKITDAAKKMKKRNPMQAFSNLEPGDYVRVHFDTIEKTFKKGYKAQWSKQVYLVRNKTKPKTNTFSYEMYTLKEQNGTKISGTFKRNELLKVANPDDFMYIQDQRPDYSNGRFFDREAHMRILHDERKSQIQTADQQQWQKQLSKTVRIQPSRISKKIKQPAQKEAKEFVKKPGLMDFSIIVPYIPKELTMKPTMLPPAPPSAPRNMPKLDNFYVSIELIPEHILKNNR